MGNTSELSLPLRRSSPISTAHPSVVDGRCGKDPRTHDRPVARAHCLGTRVVPQPELLEDKQLAPGANQWDMLRLARSNAINYGLSTEGVILGLSALHDEVPLRIDGANTDTIEATIVGDVSDEADFAKRIYDLCPDIVDQGVGSIAALQEGLAPGETIVFWWD